MGKFRYGLVGGGDGAFIGAVHRLAAELDGRAQIVAGCFGSDPERARAAGPRLYGIAPERSYPTYAELFAGEAALPESQRMQFVIIATPNHLHLPVAREAFAQGFHVVCDKPLAAQLSDAERFTEEATNASLQFALTHNYTGYPMVREARDLVASGALGAIRRVQCEYLQGWLAAPEESTGNKQAEWRTDPARAGAAGCFGDIGTHAENLVSFVTGLALQSVCAELNTFVPGRRLDDDGSVLLRFVGGARGLISASQIAVGEENALTLRVYGESGGLQWAQQTPNSLVVTKPDGATEIRRAATPWTSTASQAATRLPPGHPEGYLEAFANIYRAFYDRLEGRDAEFPSLADGLRGMRFLDAVVQSSAEQRWISL